MPTRTQMPGPVPTPAHVPARFAVPKVLLHLGVALLALASAGSLARSPDPLLSLPWAVQVWLGAMATWFAWRQGRPPREGGRGTEATRLSKKRAERVARAVLVLGYACLVILPLATEWPTYKYPALAPVYSALPSLLPYAPGWAASGISPNQTGGILAAIATFATGMPFPRLSTPVTATRGRRERRVRRVHPVPTLLAILSTGYVILSGSRAALLALVVAVLFVLVLRHRRTLWAVAGLAAIPVAAVAVRPSLPGRLIARLLHEEPLQTKLLARVDIWTSAVHGIADHPFAGIGLGTLNDVLPSRYPYGSVGLTYTVTQAHNFVLDTALTIGIPGAIGLVCLLTGILWTGVAASRTRTPTSGTILGLTAIAVVFVVFGTTDSLSLSSPSSLLLWVVVCGISSTGYLQDRTQPSFDFHPGTLYDEE